MATLSYCAINGATVNATVAPFKGIKYDNVATEDIQRNGPSIVFCEQHDLEQMPFRQR